jgi:hypothetical protein
MPKAVRPNSPGAPARTPKLNHYKPRTGQIAEVIGGKYAGTTSVIVSNNVRDQEACLTIKSRRLWFRWNELKKGSK